MFGYLIPCGGGQAVALSKTRLVMRYRQPAGAFPTAPDVELKLVDHWWHIRRIDSGCNLQVNGVECDTARLKPNDVLTIRGKFYRITFQAPEPESQTPPSPPVAPPPPPAAAPLKTECPLGLLIPCGGGPAIVLRKPQILIGRSSKCDVVLPLPYVSSRHCQLDWLQGHWQMADLDSKNGTTVDGTAYHRKWVLPGSVLGLKGKRFRVEYQSKGPRPALVDDDEVVLPKRSLMDLSGCTDQRLDQILHSPSRDRDEESRPRWTLDQ